MKSKKLIVFLILIILVGVAGIAVGATASYWVAADPIAGIAPQAYTFDFSVWQKYVTWQYVEGSTTQIEITGFKDYFDEYFIIPKYVHNDERNVDLEVVKVKNTIFADDSLKKIPTTLVIPASVRVETSAFSGLTNLKEVIFDGTSDGSAVTFIGAYAFSGCTSLKKITYNQGLDTVANRKIMTAVNYSANAFLGCNAVTTISKSDGSITYSSTAVNSNWSGFLSFVGLPSGISNPYSST